MLKNISVSFRGIIILSNLLNRLDRNTASRVISLFEMPLKKIINFARLFYSTIVLRKSSFVFRNLQVWPIYCMSKSFSSQDKA